MRAGIISERGAAPAMGEFRDPEPSPGATLIEVETTGLGGWDVLGAYRLGVEYPCVIRGEGVGRAPDGRRVYFGERSLIPFGSWAERTIVPDAEVWDVPDKTDDKTAITMAIAGTGAIVPLEKAQIQGGDSVLVLGATGVIGQISLQLARIFGAGRIVAASRDLKALTKLKDRGWADGVVAMAGGEQDVEALKDAGGGGFDVVMDLVYGPPFLSALKASKWGARLVTVGTGAGKTISLNAGDMLFRTLTCVGTGQRPPEDRRQIWLRLLDLAETHKIEVEHVEFGFEEAAQAWAAQIDGPHAKITARVRG